MDDRELQKLWEKTLPGGVNLSAIPVNATYRPPEKATAPAPAADSVGAKTIAAAPISSSSPTPVPPSARASAGANTIASAPRLPEVESGILFPPPSSSAATIRPSDGPGRPASTSASESAATIASTGGLSRAAPGTTSDEARAGDPDGKGLSTSSSFELVDELGRGGMGVVFRARQKNLDREVALKRLIPGKAGPEERAQFVAEAMVTGILDHPNIVSVHDLGRTPEGDFFLAMKLIRGDSWHDLLHPASDAARAKAAKLDTTAHIRLLLEVSNAVAFAHAKGIVHRDLKPANVMVGDFGEVLVMDWGIAVDVREGARPEAARVPHKTSVTTPAGTPCYMPPELAVGRGAQIGPATDVFLLGAILHEVVTGAPPHAGETLIQVLREALACERKAYKPDVPEALQAILHRAMAKETKDRYPDVRSLRAALEDYLAHKESLKISAAAEATLADCIAAPTKGSGTERNRRYGAFAEAVAGFRQALLLWPGNDAAKAGERRARIAFADAALLSGDLGLAEAQVASLPETDRDGARLGREIGDVRAQRARAERAARRMQRGLRVAVAAIVIGLAVGFFVVRREQMRAEGERDRARQAEVAAATERDRARLEAWNGKVETARGFYERAIGLAGQRRFQSAEACLLRALEIAPRGGAPAHLEPTWDAPGWAAEAWRLHRAYFALCPREAHAFETEPVTFTAAAVGPRGQHALMGDPRGDVHMFDLATGTRTAVIASSVEAPVTDLAISPDHRLGAAVSSYGRLRLFDLDAHKELRALEGPAWGFLCAAFSADGKRILAGGSDRKAWLFDTETGKALWSVDTDDGGPPRTPASVAVSADGVFGLVGLWDGSARLLEIATGQQIRAFPGALHWVSAVAFEPDGKAAWLGSNDGLIRRIELSTGKETRRISTEDVRDIRIARDAKSALVLLVSGGVEVMALDRGEKSSEIERRGAAPVLVAPSADGNTAVLAFSDGPPRVYDLGRSLRRPRRLPDLAKREDPIAALAISLDRKRFVAATSGGVVTLLELRGRKELARLATDARGVRDAALWSDGRRCLVGGEDGVARVLDLEGGKELRRVDAGLGPLHRVEVTDDGARALAAGEKGALIFDPSTGNALLRIQAPAGGFARVRMGGAGRRLTAASGTQVLLYDLADLLYGDDEAGPAPRRIEPRRFEAGVPVHGVDASADGVLVAAACEDRAVRVFDTATGALVRRIEAHAEAVTDLTFLADGRTTVSGSRDQTVCVVDVTNGGVLRRLRVRENGASANGAVSLTREGGAPREAGMAAIVVSRDGGTALSTSSDGAVLSWPMLDASVPADPPDDLAPLYEVIGLRVAAEGLTKGVIEPVTRAPRAP